MPTYTPVIVVPQGGIPFTQVMPGEDAPALTVVSKNAFPITLKANSTPIALFNADGTPYEGNLPSASNILGPDLIAQWSANRSDLITRSGTEVTSWRDVVGGYEKIQAISSVRPAWSATSFNGAPAVRYDGIDDQLTLTGVPLPFPIGAAPCEVWIILDNEALSSDASTRRIFAYGGITNSSRAVTVSGTGGTQRVGANVGTGAATVFSQSAVPDASGRHAVRAIFSATGVSVAIDGGSPTAETSGVPATTNTMVRSGAATNGAGPFLGKIRHILVTAPLNGTKLTNLWVWASEQRRA